MVEVKTWVVCVVVKTSSNPNKYENFYLAVKGEKENAVELQQQVAKAGFKAGDNRFFPDQIETLFIKEHTGDNINEQQVS